MKTLTRIMFYVPKKILIKFIFFLFLLLCFNIYVNAESLTSYNHYYSNEYNGSCGTSNKYTYSIIDSMGNWTYNSGSIGTVYSGKANALWFDFTYNLSANTYYDVVINAPTNDFTQAITSSLVSIGNGTSCGATNLNNISLVSVTKGASSGQYKKLTIRIFSATAVDFWTIAIENDKPITGVSTFGISSFSITQVDLSGTDIIVDNNNSNTDSIINNQQQNTNDIINNQNQNNEELKDTINDNFNSCVPSKNLFNPASFTPYNEFTNVSLIDNGINVNVSGGASSWTGAIYEFDITPNELYTISFDYTQINTPTNIALSIDGIKEIILNQQNGHVSWSFTSSSSHIRISLWSSYGGSINTSCNFTNIQLEKGSETPFEEYGKEICNNKLDDTNDKLDNLNGTLTDSSSPNTESFLDDVKNVFNDGPISTLILMPFTLLNRYVDGFNGSCSSISLGNLYGTDLSLPCIDLENKLGSTLWNTIDGLVSIFMIYNIGMLFVMVFNDITSLRDTFDSLYTPQHAKPLGKHTSEVE